jgi:hypothetical protein
VIRKAFLASSTAITDWSQCFIIADAATWGPAATMVETISKESM